MGMGGAQRTEAVCGLTPTKRRHAGAPRQLLVKSNQESDGEAGQSLPV